jgi:hypothetical protein
MAGKLTVGGDKEEAEREGPGCKQSLGSLTRSGPLDCPCPPESWLAFSQLLLNLGLNGHSKFPLLLSLLGCLSKNRVRDSSTCLCPRPPT